MVVLLVSAMIVTVQIRRTSEFERIVRASGGKIIWEGAEVIPSWLHEFLPDAFNHAFFDRSAIDLSVGRSPGFTMTDADWFALHEQLTPYRSRVMAVMMKDSHIGDKAVVTFSEYPNIEVLGLDDTLVTDESLQSLGNMAQLRLLLLDRSKVSGEDLSDLRGLRQLEYLGVSGLGLTQNARAELQSHLPDVTISDN